MPDTPPPPARVGVREFRESLTAYLRRARDGEAFLVTSHGEVVAELRPPSPATRPPRKPGGLRGRIVMAADFDETPPAVLDAMQGSGV
jgi:antitoxin (DNA-binding transcriptional repressor) of toxin-antitoxin stability system